MNPIADHPGVEDLHGLFLATALCSIRLLVAFAVMPPTNSQAMQGLPRAVVITITGLYVAAGTSLDRIHGLSAIMWTALGLKEALIGLVLGFASSTVFWASECVGALIDLQTGYNNVQLTNPLSGLESTPVSGLLQQLAISVFYALGGLLVFLGVLFDSFHVWPLFSTLPSLEGISDVFLVQETDRLMQLIVKFAAPLILVLVLIDLGFGLMTRAADKLQPMSLSQPIKGAVSMLMLALLAGVMLDQVKDFLLPTDVIERLAALVHAG